MPVGELVVVQPNDAFVEVVGVPGDEVSVTVGATTAALIVQP